MNDITYDVRVYKTVVRQGKRANTYSVRWKVGPKTWWETFRNAAQADSFRSELNAASKKGEAFSLKTGRPVSWKQEEPSQTWYAFTLEYVDMKWPHASPGHRRCIAEALTDATEALLTTEQGAPRREKLREALRLWAYSDRLTHPEQEPPEDFAEALRWLAKNTVSMSEFEPEGNGTTTSRTVLNRLSLKQNGEPAAPTTLNRKRMTLNNALEYAAAEKRYITRNPLPHVRWTRPRAVQELDLRVVVNPEQANRLLHAVAAQGKRAERMVAFFALMYYAALRPEEATDLHKDNLINLPEEGWGELLLTGAQPRSGARWSNTGTHRERRPLKHRAQGATRPVPLHPELVKILRHHLAQGWAHPAENGPIFHGPRGGTITDRGYLAVWKQARTDALTPGEAASPLARRPYDLRHAAVSTWLAAGVPAAQVAAWAGHSVAVLLKVYAKCISGQEEEAKRRIAEATKPPKPSS